MKATMGNSKNPGTPARWRFPALIKRRQRHFRLRRRIFGSRIGVIKPPVQLGVGKKGLKKKASCAKLKVVWQPGEKQGGIIMKDDVRSLSHSKWRCKYHIVFATKYRRQIIYKQLKADIGRILRELSERKGWRYWKRNVARITSTCW